MFTCFNLFIVPSSSCTEYLKVCGQLPENVEGTVTEWGVEEGESTGPAAAGSDRSGVNGWDVGERGDKGQGKEGGGTGKGRGWTEIENTGESQNNISSYLCFLNNYVSEARSLDRPHVVISRSDGVQLTKCSSISFFNSMSLLFGINCRLIWGSACQIATPTVPNFCTNAPSLTV